MDVLIVAVVFGLAFGVSAVLWHAWVHPELVFSLLDREAGTRPAPGLDVRAVAWLRFALGMTVLLVGFLTGAVVVLLSQTGGA